MTRYALEASRMRDSQELAGDGCRDGVDMSHLRSPIVIDRDLHRTLGDGGKVDRDRPRPTEPGEDSNADRPTEYPPCRFCELALHDSVSRLEHGDEIEALDARADEQRGGCRGGEDEHTREHVGRVF